MTEHFMAVYPQDMLRHYRAFLARRRQLRPSEEYRDPTTEKWGSSTSTLPNAWSSSAPAAAATELPAGMNTLACDARSCNPTPPGSTGWTRSSSTP
ncbi:hypothetical protein [Streptomyces sp. NPDC056549]|uniref:hypothetical protein n=1 Tax=Streptomyces sp. NPDC056549 TaxID=3345864 RepID=UPI00367AC561